MEDYNLTYAQSAVLKRMEIKQGREQSELFQFHTDESYDDSDYYVDIESGDY